MQDLTIGALPAPPWLLVLCAVTAVACVIVVIKRIILVRLLRITDQTPYRYDSLLLRALNLPLTIAVLVGSLFLLDVLLRHYGVNESVFNGGSVLFAKLLLILAVLLFVDKFVVGLLHLHGERNTTLRSSRGILVGITRGVVLGLGLLMFMGTLGISITPLLASLGITSLAVALALQPTLENFFSGVQLVMDKPVRVGDFIELESGEQGFVEKIGWRSTWIKMLPNNTVIMPNSVMSQSKIINYFYPNPELSVPVDVGVHYNSDLEFVEKVTLEVAREVLTEHEWGVGDYNTFVVYHTFDSSSINFTVMLRAQEYYKRFWVKSAFIKALHKRYAKEGIVIPFPIRAINTSQEGGETQNSPTSYPTEK